MSYSIAHTFFVSSESVQGAAIAQLSAIELFFKFKPRQSNNKSGIESPGATLIIVPTDLNNNPIIRSDVQHQIARLEYDQIIASSDAQLPTRFTFASPVLVDTNKWYAFALKYDGNEDFILWTSVKGDNLIGTSNPSPGRSGEYVGNYFEFIPTEAIETTSANNSTSMVTGESETPIDSLWRSKVNAYLKFSIYAARYFISGQPVSDEEDDNISFADGKFFIGIPFKPMEYVLYDQNRSRFGNRIASGTKVYQNTVFYPGGRANNASHITLSIQSGNTIVVANTRYPNGTFFHWDDLYDQGEDAEYIVVTSQAHSGGDDVVVIRAVSEIISNTHLRLSEAMPISNASAKFFKSPVGTIVKDDPKKIHGVNYGILSIADSNSNQSTRFVSGAIESFAITNGGATYNNADVLYVYGYEFDNDKFEGGYIAVANLVTNSSGGVTNLFFSNIGAYFMNASAVAISVSNSSTAFNGSNTANGTGLAVTLDRGTVLKSETFTQSQFFAECEMYSQAVTGVNPIVSSVIPTGTILKYYSQLPFERLSSANLAAGAYDRPVTSVTRSRVEIGGTTVLNRDANVVNMSRAAQYSAFYANGNAYVPVKRGGTTVNNALLLLEGQSNNDFTSIVVKPNPMMWFSSFMINNDYTLENTDNGNAWSKYISTKLKFKEDRFAEDLIMYIVAHKPVGTDIQVFGRLHSSLDTEDEFNDKDWTRLECISGNGQFSDVTNQADVKEFTFSIPQSPNTDVTLAGTVTVSSDNNQVIGVGTAFNTNLVAGDLVKISAPLFPNNHFIAVVNSVTDATTMNLDFRTANASVLGSGMKVERIRTYKKQAFKNHQADNVATYFAENGAAFDRFDTFAVKVVLLSNNQSIVPCVDNIRGAGVTA